jgi:hypothetical protein
MVRPVIALARFGGSLFYWPSVEADCDPWLFTMVDALSVRVMVPFAQGLPILFVPKKRLVSAVSHLVVHNGGRRGPTFRLAHLTDRVCFEKN